MPNSMPERFLSKLLLCLAAAGLFARASAQSASTSEVVERSSGLYTLRLHGGDDTLAETALTVVDEVWPIVASAFGAPDAKPAKPLVVNLYRTTEGFRAADQALTGGKFQRNTAMAHWGTRSAHVALQPPCTDETLRAIGLPAQTIAMLAWEAAHVARFELCLNFEQHPDWLCDGLASWTAQQVLARHVACSAEALPSWSTDIARVQRLAAEKKLPPIDAVLADQVADLEFNDRYAVRAQLYWFLAADGRGAKLAQLLQAVRSTGSGSSFAATIQRQAKSAFGDQDKPFAKHVAALQPQWNETFRSLTTGGAEWTQIAFPDRNAIAWRTDELKSKGFKAKGALRILSGGRQQMNFLFGRSDEGFYSIAFVADQGFTVFDYRSATNEWKPLGVANAPALRLGIRTEFRVEAERDKLAIEVDGQRWNYELPRALPSTITWGLGAQAGPENSETGSAGIWIELAVTK